MKHRVELSVVAAMLVPGLVACSDTGIGTTETSAAASTLWNPCTEISDDVLRAVGLVPTTEDSGITRPLRSRKEICRWDAPRYSYSVTVFSTTETVTEVEQQPGSVDFHDVTIAGRAGRQFKTAGASEHLNCNVLFATEQGAVRIRVFIDPALAERDDPCQRMELIGRSMVPVLPR